MSGSKNMSRRFVRGAVLPAAVAWMGLVGTSVGLMQAVCIPQPPATPIEVSVAATPGTTVAVNTTVTATATVANATGTVTYTWSQAGVGGLAGSTTSASATFLSATAGTAILTVTASDSGTGTSDTATVTITVTAATPPVSDLAVTATATPATGAATFVSTLSATPTGGTPGYTYNWVQTGGTGMVIANNAAQTTTVTLTAVGTYTFTVTVTDAAGSSATSSAVTVTAPNTTLAFTTSALDDLVGSAGDDTLTADQDAGTVVISASDQADGGAGADTLVVTVTGNGALAAGAVQIANVETLQITDVNTAGASTFNAANWTGLTLVDVLGSSQNLTVNNLAAMPDAAISDVTDANLTLNLDADADEVTATDDALALTLANTAGTTTVTANSIETFNVASTDSDNVARLAGDALATVVVTGTAALDISGAALPNTLEVFNASANTGGVTALFQNLAGDELALTGSAGDDVFTGIVDGDTVTADLGAGDDSIAVAGFTDGTDAINGGAGTDTLVSTNAVLTGVAADLADLTNVEQLELSDGINGTIDLSYFGAITGVNLTAAIAGNSALTGAATGLTVTVEADDAGASTMGVTVDGNGQADAVTINLENGGVAFGGLTTLTGVEVCTIDSATGANTLTSLTFVPSAGVSAADLTITGDENLTMGTVTAGTPIDASALTGNLNLTLGQAGAVTAGEGDDTLAGSASADSIAGGAGDDTITGNAGNDAIDGGAGDDTITGGAGADSVTGGAGEDTIVVGHAVGTTADSITDFDLDDDLLQIDLSEINAVITNLQDGAPGAVAAGDDADLAEFANGDAYVATATDNVFIITDTTGIDAYADVDLSGGITLGGNTANGDGVVLVYYDEDDGEAVFGVVVDTDSDADATINDSNDTFNEMARIAMSAADYAALTADSLDFID